MKTKLIPRAVAAVALLLACASFGVDAAQDGSGHGYFAVGGSSEGGRAPEAASGCVDIRGSQDRATVKLNVRDQGVCIGARTLPLSR